MSDNGTWRGCTTLPDLFRASANDWGNNSYVGVRHKQRDGTLDAWLEWETYREVELSVTAIARSLRVVLRCDAVPGMAVAILGPPSIEALKIWQACMHLSAVPVFVPCDGSLNTTQLAKLLSALNITAVFAHQEQQQRLVNAMRAVKKSEPGTPPRTAPAAAAGGGGGVPQLVVIWGEGGIRFTEPDPELLQHLTCAGVASVTGYEAFKRSHFNDEPAAAFADVFMPKPTDVAAVVISISAASTASCRSAAGAALARGLGNSAAGSAEVESELESVGLTGEWLSHADLVAAAVAMLRLRFPTLECKLQPYVAGETDGSEWAGRPHTPTSCITGSSFASTDKLVKLAAATAAAGRISLDAVDENTTADGVQLLVDL